MLQILGYISALLTVMAGFSYIKDILQHNTKPQRMTWFIFAALGGIAFFSQLAKGATNSLWLPGITTLNVSIIFLLSLKYGMGGAQKRDFIVLLVAFLGLVAWYFTKEAAIALYIVIAIDISGSYLTLEKVYKHPKTETTGLWILSSLAGFFSMLAVGKLNIVLMSYPLYFFLMDGTIAATIYLRKKHLFSHHIQNKSDNHQD